MCQLVIAQGDSALHFASFVGGLGYGLYVASTSLSEIETANHCNICFGCKTVSDLASGLLDEKYLDSILGHVYQENWEPRSFLMVHN